MMPFDDGGLLLSWPLRSFDNFLAIFRACRARPHRDKLTEAEMETGAHAQTERPEERLVIPLVGPLPNGFQELWAWQLPPPDDEC